MFKYLASAAALAMTAGGALAQDAPETQDNSFGATVSAKAQTQVKDDETKGIGAEVSALARERNAAREAARDEDEDDDDADETDTDTDDDDATQLSGRANANTESAAAQAALVATARGDNRSVRDNTGPVADLRAARSGREFGADARTAAAEARAAATESRQITANARAAAQQARDVRDTVRNAGRGRGR